MARIRKSPFGGVRPRLAIALVLVAAALLTPALKALAGGKGADGPRPAGSADGAQPARAEAAPDIALSMASHVSGPLGSGDEFTYMLRAENVGDAPANGLSVFVELPLGVAVITLPPVMEGGICSVILVGEHDRQPMSVFCERDSLAPGASARMTIDARVGSEVACGPITSWAEASARNEPEENEGPENRATHTLQVACVPSLALNALAPAQAHPGDLVTFRFAATNDGEVPLKDIRLTDPSCDGTPRAAARGNGGAILSPGETWRFTCTRRFQPSDADPATGRAAARGTVEGGRTVWAYDTHSTDLLHPAIRIIVKATPRSGNPGDRVRYSFAITNRGDTPLFDVRVTDDVLGEIGRIPRLARGGTVTLSATMRLPEGRIQVQNTATAEARDPLGLVVLGQEDASVSVVEAERGGTDQPGGTPFTGADTIGFARTSLLLASVGLLLLLAARGRPRRAPQ